MAVRLSGAGARTGLGGSSSTVLPMVQVQPKTGRGDVTHLQFDAEPAAWGALHGRWRDAVQQLHCPVEGCVRPGTGWRSSTRAVPVLHSQAAALRRLAVRQQEAPHLASMDTTCTHTVMSHCPCLRGRQPAVRCVAIACQQCAACKQHTICHIPHDVHRVATNGCMVAK